jgi:HlyD family secretion protein
MQRSGGTRWLTTACEQSNVEPHEPRLKGAVQRSCLLAILAVPLVFVLLSGCGKAKPKEAEGENEAPTPVTVEAAVKGAIDRMVIADAVLYPINQANVTAKISTPVKRMLVNRGDHVKAGQVVAELEAADLASAANEAKQQIDQAEAAYQLLRGGTAPEDKAKAQIDIQTAQQVLDAAKKLYDNRVALQREGALAQKLVDDAKVAMVQAQSALEVAQRHLEALNQVSQREAIRGAEASVNTAKAHYNSAVVQSSYARITSPISGIVSDRPIYPGEMPPAGSPLMSIVDISHIVARANVPVKQAAGIKVGRPARIAGPDGDIPGEVTVVSPAVDPSTTTIEVWVKAANPGEKLKPGQTVHVAIIAETIQDTLIVQSSALLNSDDGGQKVMVVIDNKIARERMVSVGVRQGDRVQILSGLQEGDQVVTSGGLGLEDKAKVTVQAPKLEDDDDEDADKSDEPAKPDAKKPDAKKPDAAKDKGKP